MGLTNSAQRNALAQYCVNMWSRYVAIGDSFSEGLDDLYEDGGYRGWTDRLADMLHDRNPDMEYANLAIRGRRTDRIVNEQIPQALPQSPDLVSFASGINDLMGLNWDPAATFADMERGLRALRNSGADVLVIAFGDPKNRRGSISQWRSRFELLNRGTVALAQQLGCFYLDFWPLSNYADDVYWSEDRLHLSSLGHEITALAAAEVLGLGDGAWRDEVHPLTGRRPAIAQLPHDVRWVTKHAVPWAMRRVRGSSLGDGVGAKRPVLSSLSNNPLQRSMSSEENNVDDYNA